MRFCIHKVKISYLPIIAFQEIGINSAVSAHMRRQSSLFLKTTGRHNQFYYNWIGNVYSEMTFAGNTELEKIWIGNFSKTA